MNPEERSIVENYINTIKEIIKKNRSDCGFDILDTSGSVFYTGYGTLLKPNGVYLIGINPGGIPDEVTVGEQLSELLKEKDRFYNAYQDEDWGKNDGLQIAIEDAFKNLHLCIRETCGSNLIFERTEKEESIENKQEKIKAYMYIHDYIRGCPS